MVYGNITEIRGLAGKLPEFKHSVSLGTGDGSTIEFELPAVGRNLGYIIDLSSDKTSSIDVDDIIVYVDSTPVTVASIDEDKGTVTLDSAPADGDKVTADYKWSEISDIQIISSMNIAQPQVERIIRGVNIKDTIKTESIDGNGIERSFEFEPSDVTSITTVTVDGSVLTEDTHYTLYKYENSIYYWKIVFYTAPLNGYKNIVILYKHGRDAEYIVDELSNLLSARSVVLKYVRSHKSVGQFVKGKQVKSVGNTSRLAELNKAIKDLLPYADNRKRYRLSH